RIAAEAGQDAGPLLVASLDRLPGRPLAVPRLGRAPGPVRASLAVTLVGTGFVVEGTLRFTDPGEARALEEAVAAARRDVLDSILGVAFLRNLHAYNALKGMSLRRRGPVIAFSTSMSGADAKAGAELAAEWTRRFFGAPATR